ncbi:MAG: VWA domain-containing protein [Oscillospiraceae bacterium]|jgi:hypothetical protein|nr:VWA domain-containing protein [Oscillospiraceae bacterium]
MKRTCKQIISLCLAALLCIPLALCAAAAQQKAPMDVVFLIDSSGSMEDIFPLAVEQLRGYLTGLAASEAADFRFALVDFRDFPGKTTYEEDYPYKVQADFTANVASLSIALGALDIGYGGDREESVYSALIDGLGGLSWREGAGRAAVLIGDAPALDPETETGYTAAAAAAALQTLGVTLHTVTILPDWEEDPAPFDSFRALADATGGQAVLLPAAGGLLDVLLEQARSLPLPKPEPPDPPPYAPNLDLPASITIYRKEACNIFRGTPAVRWESSDPTVLAIDNSGQIQYQFAKTGAVKIRGYDANNNKLAETQVKVEWQWWQWILVILLLGWLYL